jgi:hypothetical protein
MMGVCGGVIEVVKTFLGVGYAAPEDPLLAELIVSKVHRHND